MSYNVTGIRRFDSPNKGFAKQSPGLAKCGGEKLHKGASADCSFSEPGGGEKPPERIPFVMRCATRTIIQLFFCPTTVTKKVNSKMISTIIKPHL